MGSINQRASKLPAFKVGGLMKKSAIRPRPHLNQSARVRTRAKSNHSQSLMAGNFAALWSADLKFSALKDLNPFNTVPKVQEASIVLRVGFSLSKWPHFNSIYLVRVSFITDIAVHIRAAGAYSFRRWIPTDYYISPMEMRSLWQGKTHPISAASILNFLQLF